jgi:hypothetical protein
MDAKNWTLNSYTNGAWTTLVTAAGPIVIKSVSIAVKTANATVALQIANGSGSRAVLVPGSLLAFGAGYNLNLQAISLGAGDLLQVKSDVSGVEFAAFGAA